MSKPFKAINIINIILVDQMESNNPFFILCGLFLLAFIPQIYLIFIFLTMGINELFSMIV